MYISLFEKVHILRWGGVLKNKTGQKVYTGRFLTGFDFI